MTNNPLSILGFSDREYQIYVCMLSSGNTTVQEISQQTGIKRPTVYLSVESLIQRGFATKIRIGKKTLFRAIQVSSVSNKAEDVYKRYKESIPELVNISNRAVGKPIIEILEGEQGVLRAYEDMASAKSFRIWSDLSKVEKSFSTHFAIIANQIRKKEITTREILKGEKEAIKSSRHFALLAGPTYSARVASVDGIMNDSIIYEDTVTLFRIHDSNMYVVRIKDATVASTLSALFDMAWKSTILIKDFLKD
ncbi:MAG: hypothetical protein FGM57_00525 [Candidatus Taylorbacteria bacterium]|nr:hypothetical protein [Candidatus Taylorbacteria bacterium]